MSTKAAPQESELPKGLAAPARRALARAGVSRLGHLTNLSEAELMQLHGIGPKALAQLRQALAANELSFSDGKHGGKEPHG
jgi:DNA-directed RNA polymerase alpha subunit